MEWLINVLIVFIIIASAIKQLKEEARAAKKRKAASPQQPVHTDREDIPQPPQPISIPEMFGETIPEREIPELAHRHETPSTQHPTAEAPSYREDEWEKAAEMYANDITDKQAAQQYQKVFQKKKPVPQDTRRTVLRGRNRIPLSFQGNDVIRGIIMSEILGPPKALQTENHYSGRG